MIVPLDPRARLLQMFITENPPGVCEVGAVDVDEKTARLRCTCAGWTWENPCAHHLYVVERMRESAHTLYPVEIIGDVPLEEIAAASKTLATYRHFMLTHAKVEVMDA